MNTTVLRAPAAPAAAMSIFERYLSVWVFLCIVAGVAFGQMLPGPFQVIGRIEIAQVNLPVGLLIWVMIIPMLLKVDFAALSQVGQHWRGIGVTLFVNWAVKPFSMALLGWIFIRQVFAPYLPAGQLDSYVAGLILLAAAPCTAMVFVWSRLTGGDPVPDQGPDPGACGKAKAFLRRVAGQLPRLAEKGIQVAGCYVSETAANTFPRLPVREGDAPPVWATALAKSSGLRLRAASTSASWRRSAAFSLSRRTSSLRSAAITASVLSAPLPSSATGVKTPSLPSRFTRLDVPTGFRFIVSTSRGSSSEPAAVRRSLGSMGMADRQVREERSGRFRRVAARRRACPGAVPAAAAPSGCSRPGSRRG